MTYLLMGRANNVVSEFENSYHPNQDRRNESQQNRKKQSEREGRGRELISLLRPRLSHDQLNYPSARKAGVREKPVDDDTKYGEQRRTRKPKIAIEKEVGRRANDGDDNTCENPGAAHDHVVWNSSRLPPTDNRSRAGDRNIAPEDGQIPKAADGCDDPSWAFFLGDLLKHLVLVLTTRDRVIPLLRLTTIRSKRRTLAPGEN